MAGEQMSEREAILAARVKELEDAAAASAITVAQGGVFESLWRTINSIVSPWLAAVALALFIAHYGFAYYLQSQTTQADTQLKQAKADVETAKAKALNDPDAQGVTLRLATLKAQLDNTRADAAAAKAKATALNADVNGETIALRSAKAQLDNVQNQARLAQVKADAESARFGVSTLREREVRANLIIQKLKTLTQQSKAASSAAIAQGDYHLSTLANAGIRGECLNNEFAELIGCPSQFIQRNRQQSAAPAQQSSGAPGLTAGRTATITAINANLRPCPEATSRCAPIATVKQGSQVKIKRVAANDWVEIDVHDDVARGTWHGYVKSSVLGDGQ